MFCNNCGNEIRGDIRFCTKCGRENVTPQIIRKRSDFTTKRVIEIGIFLVLLITLTTYVIIYFREGSNLLTIEKTQKDIASAVVNIFCEGATGADIDSQGTGGSGTIITTDGLVLTNAHIIPQGKDENLNQKSCLVVLPDPTTGGSKEIYYAKPLVIPSISDEYDLAFIQIDDVYYDEEEGKAYGVYPKEFPAYDGDKYCKNENVKLGESVRIYGYPAISGGYALTITDGVVSSLLPESGYIITSAKISHGNSGGLAVDQYGCRIGVPSMVSGDDFESMGVIISNNLIYDFIAEVDAFIMRSDR
jgi:putative serine protease PepD